MKPPVARVLKSSGYIVVSGSVLDTSFLSFQLPHRLPVSFLIIETQFILIEIVRGGSLGSHQSNN